MTNTIMTYKKTLIVVSLLSVLTFNTTLAETPIPPKPTPSVQGMEAMHQQMLNEMQAIVNEADQAKRQALLDAHLKQMQPHMDMCMKMMAGKMGMDHSDMMKDMPMNHMKSMDHSNMKDHMPMDNAKPMDHSNMNMGNPKQ